jgi:hypothetical protein
VRFFWLQVDWKKAGVDLEEFCLQLKNVCIKDGTPAEARNAVYTLAHTVFPTDPTCAPQLLKELTGGEVRVLTALAALAERVPSLLDTPRGAKAITFVLESVLLGRGEEEDTFQTPASKRKAARKHETPKANASLLEDDSLSNPCRRLCAAMEFLVSYIRAASFEALVNKQQPKLDASKITLVFETLIQILGDKGLPPSERDRLRCRTRQDRAALRRCACVHILRLCDPRLGLEKKYLTPTMWHTLSESLLDDERAVRETIMEELASYLQGIGMYGKEQTALPSQAPPLRFVALVTLCSDGDHGAEHGGANGNAANVGKFTVVAKTAALQCIVNLRKACDATYAQCRAMGDAAERRFETQLKMILMPEYMVPFSIHLLTHRNETPFVDESSTEEEQEEYVADEASRQRVLRKRLKLLFEPLVHSLGDSADNISFLLRMVEILGKNFRPVDVSFFGVTRPSSPSETESSGKRNRMLRGKLQVICGAAREVLLSFVKKDVNLTPYPGAVQLPGNLFKRIRMAASLKQSQDSSGEGSNTRTPRDFSPSVPKSILTDKPSDRKRAALDESARKHASRVHFSPDVVQTKRSSLRRPGHFSRTPDENADFGNVSPIASSKSPGSVASAGNDTLGTTPPSTLRGATLRSTAQDSATTSEEQSMASPASNTRSKSSSQSPIVLAEILPKRDGATEEEEGKTTSETQSQEQSETQSSKGQEQKKRVQLSAGSARSRKRRQQVPAHIEISHGSDGSKRRTGRGKDIAVDAENRPLRRNRSRK